MKDKIILIVGPTAVGKSFASVEIAKYLDSEVISADSMQIYKYMDIGTAKVTENEKKGIPHHLIDIVYPNEKYSVSNFKTDAENLIKVLLAKGNIPVITGGTGLYVNSILYNLEFSNALSDEKIRNELISLHESHGKEVLYNILTEIDPISAERIHINNTKRVMRAIEVFRITGEPFSSLNENFREYSDEYDFIIIGLEMDRELLYNRINQRVDLMLENGLIEEVKSLLSKGYDRNLVSMQGIGYKEMLMYLSGEISFEESIRLLKRNTRRFAKRQFTWFKADERIKWINVDPKDTNKLLKDIKNYLHERGLKNETNN
jgi:tRNA dimethylallyltransferase